VGATVFVRGISVRYVIRYRVLPAAILSISCRRVLFSSIAGGMPDAAEIRYILAVDFLSNSIWKFLFTMYAP